MIVNKPDGRVETELHFGETILCDRNGANVKWNQIELGSAVPSTPGCVDTRREGGISRDLIADDLVLANATIDALLCLQENDRKRVNISKGSPLTYKMRDQLQFTGLIQKDAKSDFTIYVCNIELAVKVLSKNQPECRDQSKNQKIIYEYNTLACRPISVGSQ